MWTIDLRHHAVNDDPVPAFATDAEIAIAERLRHQIEEQYLMPKPAAASLPQGSGENR